MQVFCYFTLPIFLLLSLNVDKVASLTPGETCEMCQLVLRTVFGHFSANVPSRKKLVNQLKHECKRHFHYRRRCLMAIKDQGDFLYREMTGGDFKPIKPCFIMKECKRLQSPIPEDFVPEVENNSSKEIVTDDTNSTEITTSTISTSE